MLEKIYSLNGEPSGLQCKMLRPGDGSDYTSVAMKDYLQNKGIKHQITVTYAPHYSSVSESYNRSIAGITRSMLNDRLVEKKHWAQAQVCAFCIRNRLVNLLAQARAFGCLAYAHITATDRKNLDQEAQMRINLVLDGGRKG